MAHEADPSLGDAPEPKRLDQVLRVLESILFCCLSALIVFWVADRIRGLDFEPFPVTPCAGADCAPYVGPSAGSPWSVYTDALDARGPVSFSSTDVCTQLAQTLEERGEDAQGVDLILDLITARGTVALSRPEEGVIVIAPGDRNDGFGDVLRDALSTSAPRGCHPINYKSVFWPLLISWMLLLGLRLFRGRQAVWAAR